MFPAFIHKRETATQIARALKAHHLIDSSLFVARETHTISSIISMRPSHLMKFPPRGKRTIITVENNNLNVGKAFVALLVFVLFFLGLRAFVVDSILEDTNNNNINNNEYKGEAFRLVEKQTQKHDRRVELGMEWFRTNSGGGNRCALDKKGACGRHATCVKNVCVCAVLYGGKSCDEHIDLPEVYVDGEDADGEDEDAREKM